MAFTPRTFQQITTDMIAYVQARTDINDFNVGSVVRSILEAAALEDDEQYFQMVQLLDMFSIANSTGENLDRRLAEYNVYRQSAKPAIGNVRLFNSNLVSNQAATEAVAGSNTLQVFSYLGFSPNNFPYTIRIGEGTTRVQDVSVIALNTSSNTFTLDGLTLLTSDVSVGDRVSLVTGAQAYTVVAGTNVQAPATNAENAKIYSTNEPAFISSGNFFSNEISVQASNNGLGGNVGAGRVTQFVGTAPFQGAGVTNSSVISGGRSRESDSDFRTRGIGKIQSLSRGTTLALQAESVGVTDQATGQRVVSANVLEDFTNDEVIVYIDDGTGLEPDLLVLPQNSLAGSTLIGDSTLTLNDGSDFPSTGTILIGNADLSVSELIDYEGKATTDILLLTGTLTVAHTAGAIVRFVDVLSDGAEANQRRFNLQNFPAVRGTPRVFVKGSGASFWTELDDGTEVSINKGTGEVVVLDLGGLAVDTEIVASYSYYTNLIAEVQKVLEGDSQDSTNYPGVKAAGIILSVEAPTIRRVTVRAAISAEAGFVESDLAPLVQQSIENYILSRKIGQDVIRSKIIDAAHNVPGVREVVLSLPTFNIVVLENELPVPFDSDEESLVTVL